jgi:hypothetical protein
VIIAISADSSFIISIGKFNPNISIIEHQDAGAVDDGARDTHPLLHSFLCRGFGMRSGCKFQENRFADGK